MHMDIKCTTKAKFSPKKFVISKITTNFAASYYKTQCLTGATPQSFATMNNARRKEIDKLTAQIEEIKEAIEALRDEEQEAFDNMPESLQDGERGEKMQSAIDALEYAADDLQECLDHLSEASE